MTVEDMILEVHSQLGRPSDLRPTDVNGELVDIGSFGAQRILSWINRGYRRVLTWKFPHGRIVRFRTMERSVVARSMVYEEIAAGGTSWTIQMQPPLSNVVHYYNGWTIEIVDGTGAGQIRKIVAYTAGRVATVHKAWDTIPDATSEFKLYKNFFLFLPATNALSEDNVALSPSSQISAVMKVTDLGNEKSLVKANRTEAFRSKVADKGRPSVYQDCSEGVWFDRAYDQEVAYEIQYYGFPEELVSLQEEPKVPAQFHEAILLWVVWWGLRRYQEFSGAYSTKRDLDDLMNSLVQQFDMGNEREDIRLYIGG